VSIASSVKSIIKNVRAVCKLTMPTTTLGTGSPEMQVNSRCKQLFTDWVIELLNKHGRWPKKDIINSGARISGCNPQASRRYLDAFTCSVGLLHESRDETGTMIVTVRKN